MRIAQSIFVGSLAAIVLVAAPALAKNSDGQKGAWPSGKFGKVGSLPPWQDGLRTFAMSGTISFFPASRGSETSCTCFPSGWNRSSAWRPRFSDIRKRCEVGPCMIAQ